MSTDEHTGLADPPEPPDPADGDAAEPTAGSKSSADNKTGAGASGDVGAKERGRRASRRTEGPNWWHRSHPVFTPLSGFFSGLVLVIVLPGLFGAVLSALVSDSMAEKLAPWALVVFVIPVGLIIAPRTRRLGRYLLLGMVLTAIVVLAVAALTIYVLIKNDG